MKNSIIINSTPKKMFYKDCLCVSISSGFNLPNVVIPLHFNIKNVCFVESEDAVKKNLKEGAVKILRNNKINVLNSLTFPYDKADNLSLIDKLVNYNGNIVWNITGGQKIHTYKMFDIFNKRKEEFNDILVYHDKDNIVIIDKDGNRTKEKITLDIPLEDILEVNNHWIPPNDRKLYKTIEIDSYKTPEEILIFKNNDDLRKIILLWVNLYFDKRSLKKQLSDISPAFLEVYNALEMKNENDLPNELNKSLRGMIKKRIKTFAFIHRAFNSIKTNLPKKELKSLKEKFLLELNKNIDDIVNVFKMDWQILKWNIKEYINENEFYLPCLKEFPDGFSEEEKNNINFELKKIKFIIEWKEKKDRYYIYDIKNIGTRWGFYFEELVLDSFISIIKINPAIKKKISNIYTGVSFCNKNKIQSDIECDILFVTKSGQLINYEVKSDKVENKVVWTADNIMTQVGGPFNKYNIIAPWFLEYGHIDSENYPEWLNKNAIIERINRIKLINKVNLIMFSLDNKKLEEDLIKSLK